MRERERCENSTSSRHQKRTNPDGRADSYGRSALNSQKKETKTEKSSESTAQKDCKEGQQKVKARALLNRVKDQNSEACCLFTVVGNDDDCV